MAERLICSSLQHISISKFPFPPEHQHGYKSISIIWISPQDSYSSKVCPTFSVVGILKEKASQFVADRIMHSFEHGWEHVSQCTALKLNVCSTVQSFTYTEEEIWTTHYPHLEYWTCSGWIQWPGQQHNLVASPRRACSQWNPPQRGSVASKICIQDGKDSFQESALPFWTKCVNIVTDKANPRSSAPPFVFLVHH